MRLDKFLAEMNIGTRKEVKKYLKDSRVVVDGQIEKRPEIHIDPQKNQILFDHKAFVYSKYEYYILNKPAGVISATKDSLSQTVIDLLPENHKKDLFPVGRLDADTEGLLIITNDGELSHRLLSPKKHVSKTYLLKTASPLTAGDIELLETGVDIGDEEKTLPAFVNPYVNINESGNWIELTIHEGRFHQVKRMLKAVNNEVLFLKRIRFGNLSLDPLLDVGQCRPLTAEELHLLQNSAITQQKKKDLIRDKEAVIFDLDGTMIDSMWLWADIDREYLGRFGIPLDDPKELQCRIEGMSFHETAVYFKEHFPIPDSIEQMKKDWNAMAYDKYATQVPLKEGVKSFLSGCLRRGIRLGIATSNSRELVSNILKVHGLEDYFSCIMTGSDIKCGKPAPDIYLACADKLNVSPSSCLVFEDIMPGLTAGKCAGMTICAVADEYSSDTLQEKIDFADGYIDNYYDFF